MGHNQQAQQAQVAKFISGLTLYLLPCRAIVTPCHLEEVRLQYLLSKHNKLRYHMEGTLAGEMLANLVNDHYSSKFSHQFLL